nr:hypothetical protein [Tanacetum cinerariifolium]
MHNNIMAAGSRDRPPMLTIGRYPQWRSRFLRYFDTRPNGDALRKFILNGPYKHTTVIVQAVATIDDSPAIPEHTTVETPMNMSPANKAHFKSEKEAIHLILIGIRDEIYSTVDACQTTREMWEAIERLQQARMVKVQNDTGYNVFSNDLQHSEQSESISNTSIVETNDSNVIPDSPDMCDDVIQNEQNNVESDDERVALANLIANLKLDVNENKKIQKQLKKANITLAQELKECKTILEKTSKTLGESNSIWDMVKEKQDELIKQSLLTKAHYEGLVKQKTKTCLMSLALKTQNDSFIFVHELKQEMHADLKYIESLEKEIDKLEYDKAEFSNMYDMILQECVSNDVMCSYLLSLYDLDVLVELQCLYLHKVKECDCLAQKLSKQTESVSKEVHNELSRRFAKLEKHSISLELALQKCKEQVINDTVWNEQASNVFRKEREQYIKIQDLKAQLQDKNIAISELKKLLEKVKGKSVKTKFDKPSVVRQPNAQRIPKPLVLGKPTPFLDSLERRYFSKTKSVPKTNVSEGLSKPVTTQTVPQTASQAVSYTNMLKLGMYRIYNRTTQTRATQSSQTFRNTNPRMSTSTRVNHKTNVSRPQHKSNQLKDKVVPNNSQVKLKKTQVEDHPRIPSISNKIKSITVCNDSLNSITSNVNDVCATCGKCLVDSDHFACVTKMLNDVNARTKKPNVVPISTRKPKGHPNNLLQHPIRKKLHQNPQLKNQRVTIGCCMRKLVRHGNGGQNNNAHQDINGFQRQKCNGSYNSSYSLLTLDARST